MGLKDPLDSIIYLIELFEQGMGLVDPREGLLGLTDPGDVQMGP
jgi:hypothetical protein